jgi:hypothetical protein
LGAVSVQIGILAYRRLGWSVLGTMAVVMPILLIAVMPVTLKIHRACYMENPDESKSADGKKTDAAPK